MKNLKLLALIFILSSGVFSLSKAQARNDLNALLNQAHVTEQQAQKNYEVSGNIKRYKEGDFKPSVKAEIIAVSGPESVYVSGSDILKAQEQNFAQDINKDKWQVKQNNLERLSEEMGWHQ